MFFLSSLIESHQQKIALIRKEKTDLSIELVQSIEPHVNPLYMLQRLLYQKKICLISALSLEDVLVRSLHSKLISKKALFATLPFQIEGTIPLPKEELLVMPLFYSQKEKKETEILLLATTASKLSTHLQTLSLRHIEPDMVSCLPLALFQFAIYLHPDVASFFVYHGTENQAFFILIKEGRLVSSQPLFSQEFDRVLNYMQKKHPEIDQILITGTQDIPSLPLHLHSLPITEPKWKEYALPIGLALEGAFHKERQFSLFSAKREKKKRTALFTYLAASFMLTLSIFFFGKHKLDEKKEEIVKKFHLTGSLPAAVEKLQEELRLQTPSPLVLSDHPTLTEFLDWVSTYPPFQGECSITHLHYQLESPSIKNAKSSLQHEEKKGGPFLVKVELTFTVETPKKGQTIYQALLKEPFIHGQKNSFSWEQNHLLCRTSFFLNPKGKISS